MIYVFLGLAIVLAFALVAYRWKTRIPRAKMARLRKQQEGFKRLRAFQAAEDESDKLDRIEREEAQRQTDITRQQIKHIGRLTGKQRGE